MYSILGKYEPQMAMNFKISWVNGHCSVQNWCVGVHLHKYVSVQI